MSIKLHPSSQYIDPDGTSWPRRDSNGTEYTGSGSTGKASGTLSKSTAEHNAHIVYRFFEFLFYLGWLQVAKIMLNPFGEDEDDIEVNHIIDRNLATSFLIVNGDSGDFPANPIDTFEGMPIPIPALRYSHNESGPLTFYKLLEAAGAANLAR